MKNMLRIHYENEPFTARCSFNSNTLTECIPCVYHTNYRGGIAVRHQENRNDSWCPNLIPCNPNSLTCNLIAAWRATEILRLLTNVNTLILRSAFYAGLRSTNSRLVIEIAHIVEQVIGWKAYKRILSEAVPEVIIQATLSNQDLQCKPNVHVITEEVRAGTISWREDFERHGIKHPNW